MPVPNGILIRNPKTIFRQIELGPLIISQCVIRQQIHLPDPGKAFCQAGNTQEMLRRIIDARNDRTAENNIRAAAVKKLQVFQNESIIFTCPVMMKFRI